MFSVKSFIVLPVFAVLLAFFSNLNLHAINRPTVTDAYHLNSALSGDGVLKGTAFDKLTGEELVGATIYIEELQQGTITGLNGSFILKGIPFGSYTISGSYISYNTIKETVILSERQAEHTLVFQFEPNHNQIEEVNIVGQHDRKTEISARASEKNSLTVLNIVSARAIEMSPDLDVGSVVQRISGVTMEKNSSGESQYAIMRGMDKRYNYTLVNCVKIPSPHNKHRYIPLNLFPSELVDRIEVTKSLTADMEGDATGGVINIEMKDAPSKFTFQFNSALGYNSFFLDRDFMSYPLERLMIKSPRELNGTDYTASLNDFTDGWGKLNLRKPLPNGIAGLTLGNRFLNNKMGFILSSNFQNLYKGSTSKLYDDTYSQQDNSTIITKLREREYHENQRQYGIHLKADYRFSPLHKLEWYNALIRQDNHMVRENKTTNFSLFYDPENDNLDLSYQTRLRSNKQSIYVSTFNGHHQLSSQLNLKWSGVYSLANHREPEKSYFNLDHIKTSEFDNIYPDADGSTREWTYNTDRDIAGYLDLSHESKLGNSALLFKFGGLYRDKGRTNSQVEYRFKPDGTFIQGDNFETLDDIQWYLHNPRGSVGALEYDAHERIGAAYLQARLSNESGDVSLGLRSEYTDQGYFMYYPGPEDDPNGGQKYLDLLPSIHLKYIPNENINWRLSYFRSINRPGFFEVVPYLMIQEDYLEFGNKDLKRAVIDNVDLRWEFFPGPSEQLMVGMFYKHLKDPIEIAYTTVNRRQYGYGPDNLGNAQNLGLEIDVIKYFRLFGVKANYTYTLSAITTPKAYYAKDENENYGLFFQDQTRPLAGQSPHVANLSLLYKDPNHGWDAQIASSYTHDKIIVASRFLDADYWQSSVLQFDASFEKSWKNGFSLFGKLHNIFNTPIYHYILNANEFNESLPGQEELPGQTLIRENIYGRSILIGFRVKYH